MGIMDKKIIFYKALLQRGKNIPPTERILYSYLVFKSVTNIEGVFEYDGKTINQDELRLQVTSNNWQPMITTNNTQLAEILNVSRQKIIKAIRHLRELGYIRETENGKAEIYMNELLLFGGFFFLEKNDKINYELLIFYSYLKDKGAKFNFCIDTNKKQIAKDLDTTPLAVTKLLNRLYAEHLAKRLENGKLQIY